MARGTGPASTAGGRGPHSGPSVLILPGTKCPKPAVTAQQHRGEDSIMNDQTRDLDQADEEILASAPSDEAVEDAAPMERWGGRPMMSFTHAYYHYCCP
jgi:hypothetical protein